MSSTSSLKIVAFILASFHTSLLVSSFPSQVFPPFWPQTWNPLTNFYDCVNKSSKSHIQFSDGFYDPNYDKPSFTSILNSTAENLRCLSNTIQKPLSIFTPSNDIQAQAAVYCAAANWLNLRARSGGHDYEGLSYISYTYWQPFIVVDLRKIRKVKIDIDTNTAWVDAGGTVGELYYKISQKSSTLAFPAGLCTDLGIGGHITGGAYGSLMRKHGLGVDNVVDAEIVNARGEKLNRTTMGEELFWAIRGGGGANFCLILRWMIRLVVVPEKVTVFSVQKFVSPAGKKENLRLLEKWQTVAPTIADELFIRVIVVNAGPDTTLTIYQALYLGRSADLLNVMGASFRELGLQKKNCIEMKWIESVIFIAGFQPAISPKDLLIPKNPNIGYFKAKSDFVEQAIPEEGLENMLRIFGEDGATALIVWTPFGGKMSEFAENATPYPHRDVLFMIQYVSNWNEDSPKLQLQHEAWIRKMYDSMEKYVSKNPRQAYVNYRDLDIGKPNPDWNCSDPNIWGPKYYKGNYEKLVRVKTMVDPWNVFRNEQSIPPIYLAGFCTEFM